MKKIGIMKEFDKLGRLVIPKELRDRYGFDKKVEVVATEEGILLQNPQYILVEFKKNTDRAKPDSNTSKE